MKSKILPQVQAFLSQNPIPMFIGGKWVKAFTLLINITAPISWVAFLFIKERKFHLTANND